MARRWWTPASMIWHGSNNSRLLRFFKLSKWFWMSLMSTCSVSLRHLYTRCDCARPSLQYETLSRSFLDFVLTPVRLVWAKTWKLRHSQQQPKLLSDCMIFVATCCVTIRWFQEPFNDYLNDNHSTSAGCSYKGQDSPLRTLLLPDSSMQWRDMPASAMLQSCGGSSNTACCP